MRPSIFVCSLLSLLPVIRMSAQTPAIPLAVKFSGYVKTDIIYDTRQSCAANGLREGHFYLFPDDRLPDAEGMDLNDSPSFHILSIQSRLRGDIAGPDAFGARTSGVIEAEFFGTSDADLNGFRLRHAFTKLDWTRTSLLIGQTWHPMFPSECFPGTVSFNTGAPFTPFARNPQFRITQLIGKVGASATVYSERDFTGTGFDGFSNKYLKNSGLPAVNLQFRVPLATWFTVWAGADLKTIRPELKTITNYHTDRNLTSLSGFITMNIKTKPVVFSAQCALVQNATDLVMIGGYGISRILDPIRQEKEYTNLNTLSAWFDLATTGKALQAGLFGGYSKNLGAGTMLVSAPVGRGTNIGWLWRISPRLQFISGKLTFAGELETTAAAYGTLGTDGTVTNTHTVTNIRFLLAALYRF